MEKAGFFRRRKEKNLTDPKKKDSKGFLKEMRKSLSWTWGMSVWGLREN